MQYATIRLSCPIYAQTTTIYPTYTKKLVAKNEPPVNYIY